MHRAAVHPHQAGDGRDIPTLCGQQMPQQSRAAAGLFELCVQMRRQIGLAQGDRPTAKRRRRAGGQLRGKRCQLMQIATPILRHKHRRCRRIKAHRHAKRLGEQPLGQCDQILPLSKRRQMQCRPRQAVQQIRPETALPIGAERGDDPGGCCPLTQCSYDPAPLIPSSPIVMMAAFRRSTNRGQEEI